jgi:ornithine cyclodeaminase/alanine dehydrogenase-like protein (mu-crystallin family)
VKAFFSPDEVAAVLDLPLALQAAREAFLALQRGLAVVPQRVATPVSPRNGIHLTMPCYVRTEDTEVLSTKIVTVFEDNHKLGLPTTMAFLTLQDPQTGQLLAVMDAEHLTAMRTAAASALAVDILASKAAQTMTLFGVGGQAEAHLAAMCFVRPIHKVYVFARSLATAQAFADSHPEVEIVASEDRKLAVESSDIICATTNSRDALFQAEWLRAGATVAAVGAFRPDMCEVDASTVAQSFVVVDRLEAARTGAGDLIQAAERGGWSWNSAIELGRLLEDPTLLPADSRPRLFKSVGIAVQDAFLASMVFDRLRR